MHTIHKPKNTPKLNINIVPNVKKKNRKEDLPEKILSVIENSD
jgi:hypothetical protein